MWHSKQNETCPYRCVCMHVHVYVCVYGTVLTQILSCIFVLFIVYEGVCMHLKMWQTCSRMKYILSCFIYSIVKRNDKKFPTVSCYCLQSTKGTENSKTLYSRFCTYFSAYLYIFQWELIFARIPYTIQKNILSESKIERERANI